MVEIYVFELALRRIRRVPSGASSRLLVKMPGAISTRTGEPVAEFEHDRVRPGKPIAAAGRVPRNGVTGSARPTQAVLTAPSKPRSSGMQEPQLLPALSAAPMASTLVRPCVSMAAVRVLSPTLKQAHTMRP